MVPAKQHAGRAWKPRKGYLFPKVAESLIKRLRTGEN